jgi:cytochrome c-type biogenesis protein CcsB
VLSILFWLTTVVYAIAFGLFAVAVVFRRTRTLDYAISAAWAGFSLHTMAVFARWGQTGHPPFVSYFESMSASAWFGMLGYLALQHRKPFLRAAGAGVMPFVVLLMGWAGTHPIGGETLPVSLQSFWLFIHASFATAAAGCFLFAAGVAAVRLFRQRAGGSPDPQLLMASAERYDEFNYRLTVLGFLGWGIMIVSGAIWADAAWGRYWAWDPIELWSLISWLVYLIYIHTYSFSRRLRSRLLPWYSIAAVFFVGLSLWGVRFLYDTIHSYG